MILNQIVEKRRLQLEREKAGNPDIIQRAEAIQAPARDFKQGLLNKKGETPAIIAEVKKASPSKGVICQNFNPVATAAAYGRHGAAAISVLTEEHFFMGGNDYLKAISKEVQIPVLRKDFIIDPFQIYHARVLGADAVLLIAALLDTLQIREFIKIAGSLSLQCLVEAHNELEVESAMTAGAEVLGINNRNLKTFQVDLSVTEQLIRMAGSHVVKVSESGIKSHEDMQNMKKAGADAVLVGETLMRSADMAAAFKDLRGEL